MKKVLSSVLVVLLSFLIGINSYALPILLSYDGTQHSYADPVYSIRLNGNMLSSEISGYVLNGRTLVPARAMFEKMGGVVNWNSESSVVDVFVSEAKVAFKINEDVAVVNGNNVKLDAAAKIINGKTMIPLRFVAEQIGCKVGWFPEQKMITVDQNQSKDINSNVLYETQCEKHGNVNSVNVVLDGLSQYKVSKMDKPDRIVVDFYETKVLKSDSMKVDNEQIDAIRVGQFEDNIARVVIDTKGITDYRVDYKDKNFQLYVYPSGLISRGGSNNEDLKEILKLIDADSAKEKIEKSGINYISTQHSMVTGQETITISGKKVSSNKIFRLTDPNRIVVDVYESYINGAAQKNEINSDLISTVRTSQYSENQTRVVIDLKQQDTYEVEEGNGYINVVIKPSTLSNIVYSNSNGRIILTLKGAKLTEGGYDLKKLYYENFENNGTLYNISFPNNQGSVGTGLLRVNDGFLETIKVENIDGRTYVRFLAKEKLNYNIIYRPDENDTTITLLRPVKVSDRLVVIDPGHGGSEPGAMYGGLVEKVLNLDISLRVNRMLKQNNVKTYMTRQDDSYVGLYERANIANKLGAALFISIHNNAYTTSSKGTETLYNPNYQYNSISNLRFAQIIQNSLVNTLGNFNRGLQQRPLLVVLKGTKMPAVLTEVGFLTNDVDRANLKKEDFKENAARAICNGILQTLNEAK